MLIYTADRCAFSEADARIIEHWAEVLKPLN